MQDVMLVKSYVWHDSKCFFVSTIDRDSSAMLGPRRFAETIVWEFDWEKNERGEQLSMHESCAGTIFRHYDICKLLFQTGKSEVSDED